MKQSGIELVQQSKDKKGAPIMILDEIVEAKKKQLILDKEVISEEEMKALTAECERESISFYEALKKPGLSYSKP